MWLVEGTINGRSVAKTTYQLISVSLNNKNINVEGKGTKKLEDIISVDVISQEVQTTTGGGVTGAGAGAVLGFLIAGPLGTAVGAGLGSKSKQQGRDNTTIAIGFRNGDALICDGAKQADIGKLKVAASQNLRAPVQKALKPTIKKKKESSPQNNPIKILKRPKTPPAWVGDLKKVHGRKLSSTTKLPSLDFLTKWEAVEGCDQMTLNIFNRACKSAIDDYNNFVWRYYDHTLETEGEFNSIAKTVLENLIGRSNGIKNIDSKILEYKKIETNLNNDLNKKLSDLESHKNELSEKGFFGKGPIKQNIINATSSIAKIKKKITANKSQITRNSNILNSKDSQEIIKIPEVLEKFESIFVIRFPKIKKPLPGFDKIKNLNIELFLGIYKKHFTNIWDQLLQKDKEKRLLEKKLLETKKKEKIIEDKKSQLLSEAALKKAKLNLEQENSIKPVKDRLMDLKNLYDEDLITQVEYEKQRQHLIKQI